MQNLNLFAIFTDKLDETKIDYFITGSVASIVYGEPRLTHDIDIVTSLNEYEAVKISNAFLQEEFYCPPLEVIKNEALRSNRGHFNIIHHETGFKADIYIIGKDEFQLWALINKKEIEFFGKKLFIAPPEYVIIKKLEFYKEGKSQKHLTDIKNMLTGSGERINFILLDKYIKSFSLEIEWKEVKKLE
jgi:hypothetical protein